MEYARESEMGSTSDVLRESVAPALLEGLTVKQLGILEKVARMHSDPIVTKLVPQRSPPQVAASKAMHKRTNPGYVDLPYQSTNSMEFKYVPPPDFTRDYHKSKSDCDFQGFAAEAILKGINLNKTSH